MGLFKNIFGGNGTKKEEKTLPWQNLNTIGQLQEIQKASFNKPQIIFKHSTSCGISRMAMNMFTNAYELEESEADLYYLDLLRYRDVSNETSAFFQLMHQSPQLLVIKNGELMTHASHGGIGNVDLDAIV